MKNHKFGVIIVSNFLSHSGLTPGVCEGLAQRLEVSGWTVFTTSTKLNRFSRLLDMLMTVYRRRMDYSVALVDVFSGPSFFWAEATCCVLRLLNKPFILTLHGGNLPIFASQQPKRVRALLKSAKVVTAPSPYLQKELAPYHPSICVFPNPLDLEDYKFRLRKTPGLRIIWVRSFHKIYNPTLATHVFLLLAKDFPNLHLTMIGPDKQDGSFQEVKKFIEEHNLLPRITLIAGVPKYEIPNWLNKGDIFLNTTNIDNTPLSILEAMACGLCVVSTNAGGLPQIIKDQENGLLVPTNDPTKMAVAIRRIITEQNLSEKLSAGARQTVENFGWEKILPEWEKLIYTVSP